MRMECRLLALLLLASLALAGGGPETTIVVVNAASPVSRRVANEYVGLRDIPRGNVILLDDVPPGDVIALDLFRERIWKPIEARLAERGLGSVVRLITYSVDFPYAVDFRKRTGQKFARASLNSLTFLIRPVKAEEEFWDLQINPYYGIRFQGRRATAEERTLAMRANQAMQQRRYAEAAAAFKKMLATYPSSANGWYNYACALARLARRDKALDALERAATSGFRGADHAARDPDLASVRGDRRFAETLKRMREGGAGVPLTLLPSRAFSLEGYYLSTHLGYTGRFGNSVPEILSYLRRTAAADGTKPDGTVYFCRNGNVRSKTREPFVPALKAELEKRNRKFEIVEGILPAGRRDVIGAILGSAGFSWGKSKAEMLPGAIVEHLTSHGGNFGTPGQTKLAELMRYGAAGSSGTVTEPFAIHQKFPNPLLHVFYADGCSLAEAFYQSVWGPYQLMIVGDGLARPFAAFPPVAVRAPPAPWKGEVEIAATWDGPATELWVDGRPVVGEAGGPFVLDTTALDDGHHEVRVVGIAPGPVATRSYAKLDAVVDNHGRALEVTQRPARPGEAPELELRAPGATGYELLVGESVVASARDGQLRLPALGPGPVLFTPRALFAGGEAVRGAPLEYEFPPPAIHPAVELPLPAKPGLAGEVVDREGKKHRVVVTSLGDRHAGRRLRDLVPDASELVLEGWFEVPADGTYQLVMSGDAKVTLAGETGEGRYRLFGAAKGWHPIRVAWKAKGRPDLELMLGGDMVLAPLALRHFSFPALKERPGVAAELAAVVDGKRDGEGVAVPSDGLVLSFKRSVRNVAAVTLFPAKGAKSFPLEWGVEVRAGYGKWKPVKELERVVAKPAQVAKGAPEIPAFLELSFRPTRVKKLRLTLKGEASLAEVEVLGKAKK